MGAVGREWVGVRGGAPGLLGSGGRGAAAGDAESLCAGLEVRDSLCLGHVQDLPEREVVLSWAAVFITSFQSCI